MKLKKLLYGAAYYDEYMPYDRIEKDMAMMNKAGINTIRIAESTWSTIEPKEGVFDFTHLHRMLQSADSHGISVIVGTPTYAIPSWLAKKYPDILGLTHNGQQLYGHRQNMDITNPDYLYHCEQIIRKLMNEIKPYSNIIGIQIDNETRAYDTCTTYAQEAFKKYLMKIFPDIKAMNDEFGFNYWSNYIASWEDLPDIRGTINQSFDAEYKYFQRNLVTEFFRWQKSIIREYLPDTVFITHNFDYGWHGYSYGIQSEVNYYDAGRMVDIAGCDIYHLTQDNLDGSDISFCGAVARSIKKDNYLVLETESQGFKEWLPYEGQLRLQAYSHLANGANSVMYWPWHSIHNAIESYWKGILSHDLSENTIYNEVCTIGNEFATYGNKLVNLKKKSEIAILCDKRSQTGLNEFPIDSTLDYDNILRWLYDCLYKMNIECDILNSTDIEAYSDYKLLIIPALYSASEDVLYGIDKYVANGGHVLSTYKTGFSNEHLKIYSDTAPHILNKAFGIHYDQFTCPNNVGLSSYEEAMVSHWMELVFSDAAEVWSYYNHKHWGKYAAITHNSYKNGTATYIACHTDASTLNSIIKKLLMLINIDIPDTTYPIIIKKGINDNNELVTYVFNYSDDLCIINSNQINGNSIFTNDCYKPGKTSLEAWGLDIFI